MSKKFLALALSIMLALSVAVVTTVSVSAADPKVIKELKGSDGNAHNLDGADEGRGGMAAKTTKDEAAGTIRAPEAYNDHVYGYNVGKDDGIVGGTLYKIAFLITVNSIDETLLNNMLDINPGFSNNKIYSSVQNVDQMWANIPFTLLKANVGKKVTVVGAFSTGEGVENIEGRLWKTKGVDITVHKVIIAENGYDFGKNSEFPIIAELTDTVRDFTAAAKVKYSTGMSVPDSIKGNKGLKATVYKLKTGADLGPALSEKVGGEADFVLEDTRGNFESYSKDKLFGSDGVMEIVKGFNNVTAVPNLQHGKTQEIFEYNALILTGYIVPKTSGEYKVIAKDIDNCAAMYINDKLVFEFWQNNVWEDKDDRVVESNTTITLEKDKPYKFTFYFVEDKGGERFDFQAAIGGNEAVGFNDLFTFYTVNPDTGEEATRPDGTEGSTSPETIGSDKTNSPKTGDMAMIGSLIAAGAAGLAGLKIRRKSK